MRRLTVYIHILVFALVVGIPGAALAIPPPECGEGWSWIWQKDCKKWLPQFEITARPGNHGIHGMELDPFIPIGQDADSMLYVNVRNALFWNRGDFSNEINAGAGYRRLMGDRSWILGGYVFYDFMDTEYDNHFNQGTLGIEALAWNWEARMNGYIAGDDTKWAPGAETPGALLVGTTLTLAGAIEQAMSGFDAEVGWRLPFFGEEGLLSDTRLYAGGFWFDGADVGDLGGPMTRFETRIWDVPFLPAESRLTLGTEYRWDHRRNSQVTGLIAVRVPLGGATRSQPLTNVERRMTDRVVRDVSVVTDTSTQSSEPVRTLAHFFTPGAQVEDVLFFDDDTNGVGSFVAPGDFDDMIDLGAENALLIGLDKTGDIDLDGDPHFLWDGQTVMGGGTELRVWGVNSGQTAIFHAPGSPPTLHNETFIGPSIQLARNNTISGLGFRDMGTALYLDLSGEPMVTRAVIANNSFETMATAVEVDVEDDSALELFVTDNYFENMDTGVDLWASDSFDIALEVHRNVFQFMGTGVENTLQTDGEVGPSSFALNASGNTFLAMNVGIETNVDLAGGAGQDYTHTANLRNNDFLGVDWDDYEVRIQGNDTDAEVDVSVAVSGNHSTDGDSFVDMEVFNAPNGHVDITIVDNEVEFSRDDVIQIDVINGPDVDATISRNVIFAVDDGDRGDNADAINLFINDSGDENGHDVTIADNIIGGVENEGEAIEVDIIESYHATLAVTGNELTAIDGDGIKVDFYNTGGEEGSPGNTITIDGNTLLAVERDGIDVLVDAGEGITGDTTVTVTNNDLSLIGDRPWDSGIEVSFDDVGHANGNTININQNIVHQVRGENGIDVDVEDSLATALTLADNDLSLIEGDGIDVYFGNVGDEDSNSIMIQRNIFSFIEDDGIDVYVDGGNDMALTINNNALDFIGDSEWNDGIEVDFYAVGHDVGNTIGINNNTLANVYDDGIDVYVGQSFDTALAMAGNDISHVDDDGIDIEFYENGHAEGSTITINGGNTIAFAEDDGITVDVTGFAPDDTEVLIALNTVEHVGEDGIDIDFYGVVDGEITVQNNVVDGSDDIGIDVDFGDNSDGNEVTITGNRVLNSHDEGIRVQLEDGSDSNVFTVQGNQALNNHEDGIDIEVFDSDLNEFTITANTITDSDEEGIEISFYNDADENTFVISSNTISLSDDDGISVAVYGANANSNTLQIGGNSVDQSGDDGIDVYSDAADTILSSEINGVPQNNTVTNFGDLDAEIDGTGTGTILVNGTEVGFP